MTRQKIQCVRSDTNPREQGSLLILVVASLVAMIIMGTSYLQVARLDRIATRQTSTDHITQVKAAVIALIMDRLKQDLVDPDGRFFNPGAGDESYDYPWTNDDPALARFTAARFNGTEVPVLGSVRDDMHLASSTPDFSEANPTWSHLTNLMGIYLRVPLAGNAVKLPVERLVNDLTDPAFSDTNLSITDHLTDGIGDQWMNSGDDTDRDGIKDSRWTWAPIRQIAGVSYVMAVRLIDLSSMINLNAATAMTHDGDDGWSGSEAPRGYFPTSLDLSRLVKRAGDPISADESNRLDELFALLETIRDLGTNRPTDFGLDQVARYPGDNAYFGQSRVSSWLDGLRFLGHPATTTKVPFPDELELRYNGGLNNLDVDTAAEVLMEKVLRRIPNPPAVNEAFFYDVHNDIDQNNAGMAMFFQGGADSTRIDNRQYHEVRKMLTTISGANVFAPNHNDIHEGSGAEKYDLAMNLYAIDGSARAGRIVDILDRLSKIFQIGRADSNAYLGNDSDVVGTDNLLEIATEYALAIVDYSDADTVPSAMIDFGGSPVLYCGMETLPFIREVYIQFGYEDTDTIDTIPDQADYDQWVRRENSRAMAIEIGNPFDRPIDFDNMKVRIVVGSDEVELDPDLDKLDSGESAIIYSNPQSPVNEAGKGSNLAADLGFDGAGQKRVKLADGKLTFSLDRVDVTVELQVQVLHPNGTKPWVTYDRFSLEDLNLTSTTPILHQEALDPTKPYNIHVQASRARDGRHMIGGKQVFGRYVSNNGADAVGIRSAPSGAAAADQYILDMELANGDDFRDDPDAGNRVFQLTIDDKQDDSGSPIEVDANHFPPGFQIPIANRQFFSVAELGWILMFGFTSEEPDGDFPQRLDEFLRTTPERLFLDFSQTASVPFETGIPHAGMLMDQFTTLSPLYDLVDNDGNGHGEDTNNDGQIDENEFDPGEMLVSGTININTAPRHILTLAAPLPEPIDDIDDLMQTVIEYRDNPREDPGDSVASNRADITNMTGTAGNNLRIEKGIASIGELMFIRGGGDEEDMQRYGEDNSDVQIEHDLYPLPEQPGDVIPLSATDGAEEKMARFQFLSQAFTTRSDFYVAYVKILGYPSTDFRKGPVESAHFFAIFDRSGIINGTTDRTRPLAVRDLD